MLCTVVNGFLPGSCCIHAGLVADSLHDPNRDLGCSGSPSYRVALHVDQVGMCSQIGADRRIGDECVTCRQGQTGATKRDGLPEVQANEREQRLIIEIMLRDPADLMSSQEPASKGTCSSKIHDFTG